MRLTGARHAYWRADLLDYTDALKRPLHEFSGGSYEQNANRAVRGGGSLTFRSTVPTDDISWGADRIQLWYSPGLDDNNEPVEWARGIFLISMPDISFDDEAETMEGEIKLMDKLSVLDQDSEGMTFSLCKGTRIVDAVKQIIRDAGETNVAITDSDEMLRSCLTWEADTSKLQIINDLLSNINYYRLRADGYGQFTSEPYIPSDERAVVHTFRQGDESLHIPQWSREDDWFKSPNKVVMISQGDDDEEGFRAEATNENPDSKYSYQNRGNRWVVHTETGVEVTSQKMLDDLAKMRLGGLQTTISNMTVSHAMLDIWPDDRVDLETDIYTTSVDVRSFTVSMNHGALMEGTWKEIVDV